VQVELRALLTSALDRGEWSVSSTGGTFLGKEHLVVIGWEAGWNAQSVWTWWSLSEISVSVNKVVNCNSSFISSCRNTRLQNKWGQNYRSKAMSPALSSNFRHL